MALSKSTSSQIKLEGRWFCGRPESLAQRGLNATPTGVYRTRPPSEAGVTVVRAINF